jgi:acetyltransferase-like isoleucine patch superfamily enzyme
MINPMGPWSGLHPTAKIADSADLEPFCFVGADAVIGEDSIIQCHVRIGPNCDIGACVEIKSGAKITAWTLVYGDVFIGPNAVIAGDARSRSGGMRTVIASDVWIGANVTILPRLAIYRGVIVGAGAVVTKSIMEPGTYVGAPARRVK